MFRGNLDKAHWYLSRGLAEVVSDEHEPHLVIRLTFEPNGEGNRNQPFYLSVKTNQCVVCGTTEDLTRHHVVPHAVRKYLSEEYKSKNHYDVLLLCRKHHNEYNSVANHIDEEAMDALGINLPKTKVYTKAFAALRTLIAQWEILPEGVKEKLHTHVTEAYNVEPSLEAYKAALESSKTFRPLSCHAFIATEAVKQGKLLELVQAYRQFFIDRMTPLYLPDYWIVKADLKGNPIEE